MTQPDAEANGVSVYHAAWMDLLPLVPRCDAVMVDAPYSSKTHKGHDGGVADLDRRSISYAAWGVGDVRAFVEAWHPRCDGWIVSITDDGLAPVWSAALADVGRYVFAAIPYVAPGSRVRLLGDGPSAWTCWIIVARPRNKEFSTWGTLPGAYVLPPGMAERMPVVGGKPPWLMCRLAEDYSRPGGLIVDPCAGAGTTGIGAIRTGRRAVLGDLCREHVDIAAAWIKNPHSAPPGMKTRALEGQTALFGEHP